MVTFSKQTAVNVNEVMRDAVVLVVEGNFRKFLEQLLWRMLIEIVEIRKNQQKCEGLF